MLTSHMGINHGSKAQEERCCIVRTRTSFGMKLDRETWFPNDVKPLNRSVIGVDVADFNLGTVLVGNRG
jgi:hypothetical protein